MKDQTEGRGLVAVVTGAAGFVGSHLAELLLSAGDQVRAVDSFTDYYARALKEENLTGLLGRPGFTFVEDDVGEMALEPLLEGADVIFHLAGQPGVRPSWGREFATYTRQNVVVTQRLLEASARLVLRKFIYASSSSVYGDAESFPTVESERPQPVSPYGVTKLAGEHLCELYRKCFKLPTASLRLFTVYGPRQRPDMAFAKLVRCSVQGEPFELFGDGGQTRDFTFVADVVRAMRDVAKSEWCGVANIGGGARTSMNQVLELLGEFHGPVQLLRRPAAHGDARHTSADTTIAARAFGYRPRTSLATGLKAMVSWERQRAQVGAA